MKKMCTLLLGMLLVSFYALSQRTVTGTVTDDKGNPVASASITVKGTKVGAISLQNGSFQLMFLQMLKH